MRGKRICLSTGFLKKSYFVPGDLGKNKSIFFLKYLIVAMKVFSTLYSVMYRQTYRGQKFQNKIGKIKVMISK